MRKHIFECINCCIHAYIHHAGPRNVLGTNMAMLPSINRRVARTLWLLVALTVFYASAQKEALDRELSLQEIDDRLQSCEVVQELNLRKVVNSPTEASWTKQLFDILFPGSPAVNAILATAYISGPPNFILALVPANIDPSSLTVMVAFAVGGLLGDALTCLQLVFFHLMPQTFMGEAHEDKVRFVMVEEKRNTLLGLAIMVGFVAFVVLDKGMRIAAGGEGGHSHSHGHDHSHAEAMSTAVREKTGELRQRKGKGEKEESDVAKPDDKAPGMSIKVSSYLNMAYFSHNITDGLAIAASFYAGPTIGATTTVAVFFHEIPHEVGDFALLIQGGFTKGQAIVAQFVAAIGAFLGTFIGIFIQEYSSKSGDSSDETVGLFGTSATLGDLVLPFTAGGFLYIATVGVIPELLETGPNKGLELKKSFVQALAMAAGAGIMLAISWAEA
ncbi:Zinc transporter [Drechslerella dactyloides]|uniref:Zinc transporter n=1 Tax=Drechslerella dactyloides TaxID=74499 RepID=A0AAD6IT80_DREDA|nr:Zinc transporter [Drechslerella dactyloides]